MAAPSRLFVVAMLLLGATALGGTCAPSAWACSCAGSPDERFFELADAVFVGVVVDRDDPEGGGEVVSSARPIIWSFEVQSVQKGQVSPDQVVRSSESGASCGYEFEMAGRYQVFAQFHEGNLHTGLCSGNRSLVEGVNPYAPDPPETPAPTVTTAPTPSPTTEAAPTPAPTLDPGNEGTPTFGPVALDDASPSGASIPLSVAGAAAAVLGALVLMVFRKRRTGG